MNVKAQTILWIAQRASAVVLALCVTVHLATMVYAIRGGLSAAEILTSQLGPQASAVGASTLVLEAALADPGLFPAAAKPRRSRS